MIDNQVILDPAIFMNKDILDSVLHYLNPAELTRCEQLSKTWNKLASDDNLWKKIMEKLVFGNDKWNKFFGRVDDAPFPTQGDYNTLKKCYKIVAGNVVNNCRLLFIPKEIEGKLLTLIKFKEQTELAHPEISILKSGVTWLVGMQYVNKKSYWIHITLDFIKERREINFDEQTMNFTCFDNGKWLLPKALEVMVCFISEYVTSGEGIFFKNTLSGQEKYCKYKQVEVDLISGYKGSEIKKQYVGEYIGIMVRHYFG